MLQKNSDKIFEHTSAIFKSQNGKGLIISNGLISREFLVQPYFACFSFRNLMTYQLDENKNIMLRVTMPANGYNWYLVE